MAVQPRGGSDLRGLKALVGILGVLVILGTALVIGIIIHRIYAKAPAPAPASAMVPGMPAPGMAAMLPRSPNLLGRSEHVSGIAGAGGNIAIWVTGPAGDRILLLDPVTGKLTVALSAPP